MIQNLLVHSRVMDDCSAIEISASFMLFNSKSVVEYLTPSLICYSYCKAQLVSRIQ